MRLKEARAEGVMTYTGKVCKRHPELNGERRAKNGLCVACKLDYNRATRAKNRKAYNARVNARRAAIRAGTHVPRKYRRASEVER
jgi:hypothetical protein